MNPEVIKEFLVSLGFEVNDSSFSKFTKSISTASVRVAAMATAIQASAAAVGYAISGVSEDFENLGYQYRLITPAINKAIILRRELFNAYGKAGINIQQAVVQSVKLNMSITKTKYALEALYKSVASKFFVFLTKQSDTFREKLYQNMPKIQQVVSIFVENIFKALDIVYQLGERAFGILKRLYDFFVDLHRATDGWSTIILGAVAAWNFLNLSFLNTPLGRLFLLGTTLLMLYDDLKTFLEGGESFINWASDTTQTVAGLTAVALGAAAAFGVWALATGGLSVAMGVLEGILAAILSPIFLVVAGVTALAYIINKIVEKITGINYLAKLGKGIIEFVGGASTNIASTPTGIPYADPVAHARNTQNQQNINANSQTTIYTQPGADADGIGKAAGDSYRTYFDRITNMSGNLSPGGTFK